MLLICNKQYTTKSKYPVVKTNKAYVPILLIDKNKIFTLGHCVLIFNVFSNLLL